jgi:hypothetical protein
MSDPDQAYDYDFTLLSIAVSLVYAYGIAFPVLLWLALRYLGVGEWSVVEALAIWGYAQFVWIPVSVSNNLSSTVRNHLITFLEDSLCRPCSPYEVGTRVSGLWVFGMVPR